MAVYADTPEKSHWRYLSLLVLDLRTGDVLDICRTLSDDSVNLIATDPPYFRVKDEPWDRAWDSDAGFLSWLGLVLDEFRRVLAPNGSLYLFASPRMAARVEVTIEERFNVLSSITWNKPPFATKAEMFRKTDLRSFFPSSERIVFAEPFEASDSWQQSSDGVRASVFEPLRAYLDSERQRVGVPVREVAEAFQARTGSRTVTGMAGHWFGRSQWALPTVDSYEWLRGVLNASANGSGPVLRREYEDLRSEYEDLRRPFNVTADVPYTDVWTYPTVSNYPGKHPCEKPTIMMEHIIAASSRPNDLVFDPFLGSGSTGVAAVNLGRQFIGSDMSQHWVDYSQRRLAQRSLFTAT